VGYLETRNEAHPALTEVLLYTTCVVWTWVSEELRQWSINYTCIVLGIEPGSSVGIVSDRGLDYRVNGVRSPAEARLFLWPL
jgi:hypothetical protein